MRRSTGILLGELEGAECLVYLLDNCGEIVLDKRAGYSHT